MPSRPRRRISPATLLKRLDQSDLHQARHKTPSGRLYAANCIDVLAEIPSSSVDLVCTSPPYERQPKYGNGERYDRQWFEEDFLEITAEILRVLRPSGQFVLNYRSRKDGVERSTLQYELVGWLQEQGFLFADDHIWVKPSPPPGRFRQTLKDAVEYCFRFAKSDAFELYPDQCAMPARWDARDRERRRLLSHNHKRVNAPSGHGRNRVQAGPDWVAPSNVLTTEPEFSRNPAKHPARFPPALPEFFIKLCTRPGDVVLDPFAGTSTTAVVAEALDRAWIMAELDEDYCDLLPERLADLERRIAAQPDYPPGAIPDAVRIVPLPFALPAPNIAQLRPPDEVVNRVNLGEVSKIARAEDPSVTVSDNGPEGVVESPPAQAL
jgi:site-specific DNA-methyltransferase (adenine-specific)